MENENGQYLKQQSNHKGLGQVIKNTMIYIEGKRMEWNRMNCQPNQIQTESNPRRINTN